ncbi:MAG: ribbon-helix-helix protein, CopG family [Chloroflexota bacterium]|nr:ribbon-helix-helix protein, CopG family [Chloroflexota bacterium]MDE2682642.1 ribbon-helix-helix protein, CopG family [Chloroflexota bacterium]
MAKRLEILLDDAEYAAVEEAAKRRQVSVSEWVRQALRDTRQAELTEVMRKPDSEKDPERIARKLKALEEASKHNLPTADIDQMLQEIRDGYMMR